MKNIDKLAKSARSMVIWKQKDDCDVCAYYEGGPCEKKNYECGEGMERWLNQEVNPMPKLEIGDVVKTEYGEYVVIDDNKVVNPITMKRTIFNNICVTTRFIYRYSEDEYKEIWSVYND